MQRKLAKVKTIKKGTQLLPSRPQVKYGFIAKYKGIWPTRHCARCQACPPTVSMIGSNARHVSEISRMSSCLNRRGISCDRAAMESIFSKMKIERISKSLHQNRDELRADVFD